MPVNASSLKAGDKVTVTSFEATVLIPDSFSTESCTKIQDANGNVHYVYETQLDKALPYIDGLVYRDSQNNYFQFAKAADGKTNRWLEFSVDTQEANRDFSRPFTSPVRPLQLVTFGEALSD